MQAIRILVSTQFPSSFHSFNRCLYCRCLFCATCSAGGWKHEEVSKHMLVLKEFSAQQLLSAFSEIWLTYVSLKVIKEMLTIWLFLTSFFWGKLLYTKIYLKQQLKFSTFYLVIFSSYRWKSYNSFAHFVTRFFQHVLQLCTNPLVLRSMCFRNQYKSFHFFKM